MSKVRKRRLAAAAIVLTAALLAAAWFYVPGLSRPQMEEGDIRVSIGEEGLLSLSWPESGTEGAAYLLEIDGGGNSFQECCRRPAIQLRGFTPPFTVRIRVAAGGKNLLGAERVLTSWNCLEASVPPLPVEPIRLRAAPGPGTLDLSWEGEAGMRYEISALEEDGGRILLGATEEQDMTLVFDEAEGLELPGRGRPLRLVLQASWREGGCLVQGLFSDPVSVSREELLGNELALSFQEMGPQRYRLRWMETQGDYDVLFVWRYGGWQTLGCFRPTEPLFYDLGKLSSGARCRCRLTAQDYDGVIRAAEELTFYASVTPLGCTVWPIQELDFYEDPSGGAGGTIPIGTALGVLAVEGPWFWVWYQDREVCVDSRRCMIDLYEYLGDYCSYYIANGNQALLTFPGQPISGVTGMALPGYAGRERVDGSVGLPCLYPCAQKLLKAAQAALADGYRLKIYDAFHPARTSQYLRSALESQSPTLTERDAAALDALLPEGGSPHIRGVALDVTLETADTEEEVEAQSPVYELSPDAAASQNNDAARRLAAYMTAAGFKGQEAVWWHFEDGSPELLLDSNDAPALGTGG